MANDQDIKTVIKLLDGHQSLIDNLITALSRVRAGEALELHQEPRDLLSRSKDMRMEINELKKRYGLE